MSAPVKEWSTQTAIEQIKKCDFECEGGPLANNDAWRWIVTMAERGPEFWPGQAVWYEVKADVLGVEMRRWAQFKVLSVTAGSDADRRYWVYTITDALPDAYYPGGKNTVQNLRAASLRATAPTESGGR